MFVYFNENGVLLEVVNDKAIYEADSNYDKIYVYWDNKPNNITFLTKIFKNQETGSSIWTTTSETSVSLTTTRLEIPYDSKRDLKYFEYNKEYDFYVVDVVDSTLVNGISICTIRATLSNNSIRALQSIPFQVKDSVVAKASSITQDQYNYLISLIGANDGIATLDSNGKVPFIQLPDNVCPFGYFVNSVVGEYDNISGYLGIDNATTKSNILSNLQTNCGGSNIEAIDLYNNFLIDKLETDSDTNTTYHKVYKLYVKKTILNLYYYEIKEFVDGEEEYKAYFTIYDRKWYRLKDTYVSIGAKTKATLFTFNDLFIEQDLSALSNYALITYVDTFAKSMSINSSTYVLSLLDKNGNTLSTIDLPLESMVVSGRYDSVNKLIILTLKNGQEISFSVADLVSGLVPDTRTICGITLQNNISKSDLFSGLGFTATDIILSE